MASVNDFLSHSSSTEGIGIQGEQDLIAAIIQFDWEEFTKLANLTSEFHVVNRTDFPFRSLAGDEIRRIYGFPIGYQHDCSFVRGNYVAGSVFCDLRKQAKANSHRFPDLTMIYDLPTELIQEIFERLHPIDLYNLMRSSKGIRSLLLSRRSSALWSGAFARHSDIPSCPFDIAFPKWASMLFGPNTCDDCGGPEAMVDFGLQKRQCQSCLDAELQYSWDFEDLREKLGSQYEVLWTLVKPNCRYDSTIYPSGTINTFDCRYSKREAEEQARQIQGFLYAIQDNIPNAEHDYDTFKTQNVGIVRESQKHIESCNKWCSGIYSEIEDTFIKTLVPLWLKKWKKYLAASGHSPRDIADVEVDMVELLYEHPLNKCSRKGLRSFSPIIRNLLSIAKASRLAQERQIMIDARKTEVGTLYSAYLRTLDPMTWAYLPGLVDICLMEATSGYIYSDDASQTLPAEYIEENIRQYVDKWLEYGRRQLTRTMAEYHMPEPNKAFDGDALDLATATFICPLHVPNTRRFNTSAVVIGWEDAALHFDCIVPRSKHLFETVEPILGFSYSIDAYDIVKHLLELLDLDAHTTLACDIDALTARFMCRRCSWDYRRRTKGRDAMTLKECVSHALKYSDHTPQSFGLLSDEFAQSISFHENSFSLAADPSWCCRRCSEHFEASTTRKAVISHVKDIHSIDRPVARTDFFYRRSADQPGRKKYFVELDPPKVYCCHKCPDTKRARLWTQKPLLAHLGDKHGIQNPVQNLDWIELGLGMDPSQDTDPSQDLDLSHDWVGFLGDPELQMFS